MYHLRFKGSHYEAGFKRGSIFKKYKVSFPIHLDSFQMDYGIKAGEALLKVFSEGYDEVLGITKALGADHQNFLAWMMCMGCCMYNLEDNIPEVKGCSAFAFTHQGITFYGRNNDLPPYLKKGSKAEIYQLDDTPKFYMTTSSFVNGEEGANEHGLVVAMTFVTPRLNEIKPGLNSVFIVRYLLEKAKDTQSAINLLQQVPVASSCNILLADKTGDIVVVECHPNIINIRKAIENKNGEKYIVTTNEFLSSAMKIYEQENETYKAHLRYKVIINALKRLTKKDDPVEYAKEILKGNFGFTCQYDKLDNFETVWSTIINLNSLEIFRAEGHPRKATFITDNRLIDVTKK
ncbi:MAG: C45 family autoproteolytic acyltransferase/hydrolase [Bacilli bacterium]|nr:C45 family autoproteolytic acyltransferase/hydrolase [Bacilli bacterium]